MPSDVFGIIGTTVAGAFRVEAVVAEGGFAVVYRAHHAGFKAPVALKCLKIPQYFTADEQQAFREQFEAEAELLFKLSASIPTVVRPLHVEAVLAPDGTFMPFLALEWLEGETLDRHVQRRVRAGEPPPSLDELTELLTPVARALERGHHFAGPSGPVSIVHRDMKPENLFVARVGGEQVVKILDFGIAKAKSMANQVAGRMSQRESEGESFSPAYAAPEQWAPKRYGQTGPWTDVWGLALTMVELAAGHPVIDGDNAAMMGTALDERRRPTPRTEGLRVTDAVEVVFARALAVDPRERYPDVGLFWNELSAALGMDVPDPPRSRQSSQHKAHSQSKLAVRGLAAIASGQVVARESHPSLAIATGVPDLELPVQRTAPPLEERRVSAPLGLPGDRADFHAHAVDTGDDLALELDFGDDLPRRESLPVERTPQEVPFDIQPASGRSAEGARRSPLKSSPEANGSLSRTGESGAPKAVPSSPTASPALRPLGITEAATPAQKLLLPAALVVVGIMMTVGGAIYAASTGEIVTLGPLRLTWIAALLVLGGIGWAIYRFVLEDE